MNANPGQRIEHCVFCTPEVTPRMSDLGVAVSTQSQFIYGGGEVWEQMLGPERGKRGMVTREWLDAGVHLALGSDASTTPWYAPQVTLFGAVSRATYARTAISQSRH